MDPITLKQRSGEKMKLEKRDKFNNDGSTRVNDWD